MPQRKSWGGAVSALLSTSALALACMAVPAWAGNPRAYQIPAGDLRAALRAFARQSDWQVLFTTDIVAGRSTAGFSGVSTTPDALAAVLSGTGLTYRVANADTLLIVRAAGPGRVPATTREPVRPVAQDPDRPAQLDELVVTATRIPEPAGRVPLSLTAETQAALDRRGIRSFSDLAGATPALQQSQTSSGVANVVIRGIANTAAAATAPTTGFYLDDTPIHKRNVGGFINNNGTPLPPLFDLDRVEVLRGPQGTLFGGSSEGGTIRYITPQPSLSRPSAYIRTEASLTHYGAPSWEAGAALGAPLVTDRLGFRASVYVRRQGGYIDYVDPYTQQVRLRDVNDGQTRMFRGALAWAPAEGTRATLAYFGSAERSGSNVSGFTLPATAVIVEAPVCFATTGVTSQHPVAFPAPVPCNQPGVTFRRPGATYGPYPDLKSYQLLSAADPTPTKTDMQVVSLTLEHQAGSMTVRAISSYVHDQTRSQSISGANEFNLRPGDYRYPGAPPSLTSSDGGGFQQGLGISAQFPMAGAQGAPLYGFGYGFNRRYGISEEVRFSATEEARPVSWVAGIFFSDMRGRNTWYVLQNIDLLSRAFYGLSAQQRYGIGTLPDPERGLPYLYDRQDSAVRDLELAWYGEANVRITDRLKVIGGIRTSRVQFDYNQAILGAAAGFANPTEGNRGLSSGQTAESPVTPKLGVVFQMTPEDMVYATAAKGYRAGGVNGVLSPALCDPVLARFGLTSSDIPKTFASDQVWSYEAGGKFRALDGRVSVAADVYRIDWSNIQTAVNFSGCGSPFITNATGGRVTGGELQVEARVAALSLSLAAGYVDGHYTGTATAPAGPGAAPLVIALNGQPFATPPLTIGLGAQWDQMLGAEMRLYGRADWRFTAAYWGSVYGVPGYSPDTARVGAVGRLNLRVGVQHGSWDAALFVINALEGHGGPVGGGRSGCTVAGGPDCLTYGQYNPFRTVNWGTPRQVGLQLAYRR